MSSQCSEHEQRISVVSPDGGGHLHVGGGGGGMNGASFNSLITFGEYISGAPSELCNASE